MGCISKLALFVLNFLIFAAGVAVVALASIVIHKDNDGTYGKMLGKGVFTLPVIVLIAGLIVLTIGFLGCCGAMKESSCMLKTYAFIVIVLLLAEFTLGILVLVYPSKAETTIKKLMNESFMAYGGPDDSNTNTNTVDALQSELKCCGVNDYEDWKANTYIDNGDVTKGCCIEDDGASCFKGKANLPENQAETSIYTRGCFDALVEEFQGEIVGLGVVLFALVVVQVLAVVCACGLAKNSGTAHYA